MELAVLMLSASLVMSCRPKIEHWVRCYSTGK